MLPPQAWRRETRPDKLRGCSCREVTGASLDEMRAFYPFALGGAFDKLGHPLYAERTGRVDVDAMLIITEHEKLVQNHIRMMEVEQVNACVSHHPPPSTSAHHPRTTALPPLGEPRHTHTGVGRREWGVG